MRIVSIILVISFLVGYTVPATAADPQMEDVVYLKNGSIIRGMIVEQIPNEQLKIQTSDGSVFVFTFDEIERIAKEEAYRQAKEPSGGEKNTAVAFILSFLIPGGGQFYNGQNGKGAAMLLLYLVGAGTFFANYPQETADCYGYYCDTETSGNETLAYAGLAAASAVWLWSVIDAPVIASRMNRERGYSLLNVRITDHTALNFSVDKAGERAFRASLAMSY